MVVRKTVRKLISTLLILSTAVLAGCNSSTNTGLSKETPQQAPQAEVGTSEQQENTSEKIIIADNSIYDKVLEKYYNAMLTPDPNHLFETGEMICLAERLQFLTTNEAMQSMGYTYKDINKDNIDELIIVDTDTQNTGTTITGIYTNINGEVTCVANGHINNSYNLLEDGKLLNLGKDSAYSYNYGICELESSTSQLKYSEYYFTDIPNNTETNGSFENVKVYTNTTGNWSIENSEELNISVDEFFTQMDELANTVVELNVTPFTQYKNSLPIELFDFATDKLTDDTICAVGYLGYYDTNSIINEMENDEPTQKSGLLDSYPFLREIPEENIIKAEGFEWYVLIPTKETSKITVSTLELTDDGIVQGNEIYKSDNDMVNSPILLRCNFSDIAPSAIVSIETPSGEKHEFSPALSLMDGTLQQREDEKILDITPYEKMSNMMFKVITDVTDPEYIYYQDKAYRLFTNTQQTDEETERILIKSLKDSTHFIVETIVCKETGEVVYVETIDEITLNSNDAFYLDVNLNNPNTRIIAKQLNEDTSIENIRDNIELLTGEWICSPNENSDDNTIFITGGMG